MKLTKISVYRVDLPFHGGAYKLSGGREWKSLDSTFIRLDTDEDIVGWGETCPFGANYLQAFASGARAGIAELAPALLGLDVSRPGAIYARMNDEMLGHPYVKHGIDMACWDILGKRAGVPLFSLFGGRVMERVPVSGGMPLAGGELQDEMIARYRKDQCRQFSTKASGDPDIDISNLLALGEKLSAGESIKLDANGGWRVDQAIRVMRASAGLDIYFEQPCKSYEECRIVHRACGRPLVLDECALELRDIVRAHNEGVCHAVNVKIGRVGGLTPALAIRDVCASLGIPVHVQCAGGSGLTQAAIVHLAHSTPASRLLYIWDIGELVSMRTVDRPIARTGGTMRAGAGAGLGVAPLAEVLAEPVAVYED